MSEKDRERFETLEQIRIQRARLYGSVSTYVRWAWVPIAAALCTACVLGAHAVLLDAGLIDDAAMLWALLGALPPLVSCYALRPVVGARALARREVALKALPFAVGGWMAALEGGTEGTAKLIIHFANAQQVDAKVVADAFYAIDGKLADAATFRITFTIESEGGLATNVVLVRWLDRAMRVLLLLHARFPIDSIDVRGFGMR